MSHYFIGIRVSEQIKDSLIQWQKKLADSLEYKVWTSPEDFHITLKFLGSASEKDVETYKKKLEEQHWPHPFRLQVGPAGYFGNKEQPRVFYADVTKEAPLMEIKEKVEEIGEALGFQKEKRNYHPHVTIAKKNLGGESPLVATGEPSIFQDTFELKVSSFSIFQIHPKRFNKYEVVSDIALKGER
ncbi:RNA 2',3'-cyclic phosphodiesterase [Halobacillus yeomjeoni]|uniref:RNA 2',3'-cyclic phosphodiesterase n=1 Tax=Halobacillus yeomjeoni TaxID=311194 RepID=A0A931HVA9_9BACI|nr:RNA 2',3'-cyclic phosphodiesterase [Halobacillus yeomjeoni]MBH0230199.1 RNA 2',3'-cyclic phosphodiesterase [Halobacillus yeomjeoni]